MGTTAEGTLGLARGMCSLWLETRALLRSILPSELSRLLENRLQPKSQFGFDDTSVDSVGDALTVQRV
jgi:hypothetical protein